MAVMLVGDTTVNEVAEVPPKLTSVAPVKAVPVMVTVVPALALVGVNVREVSNQKHLKLSLLLI
jgi:hypothetical protein